MERKSDGGGRGAGGGGGGDGASKTEEKGWSEKRKPADRGNPLRLGTRDTASDCIDASSEGVPFQSPPPWPDGG